MAKFTPLNLSMGHFHGQELQEVHLQAAVYYVNCSPNITFFSRLQVLVSIDLT